MEKGRKLVIGIGVIVLVIIGWIMVITFKSPQPLQMGESVVPANEMGQLRSDLKDYIIISMKKERPSSELVDIALSSPMEKSGKIEVPYVLTFKEAKDQTTATVQATALLEHEGQKYKVVKVVPHKETITYDDSDSVIKANTPAK